MSAQTLSCRELIEFLADYLEAGLPPAEHAAFEAHLALCPDCVTYLASYRETIRLGKLAFARGLRAPGRRPRRADRRHPRRPQPPLATKPPPRDLVAPRDLAVPGAPPCSRPDESRPRSASSFSASSGGLATWHARCSRPSPCSDRRIAARRRHGGGDAQDHAHHAARRTHRDLARRARHRSVRPSAARRLPRGERARRLSSFPASSSSTPPVSAP